MFGERFKIRGHALNDPEVRVAADLAGCRPRFLKQLVNRFVIQRAGVLIFSGKEVRFVICIEIDAERLGDSRLPAAQRVGIFLMIAMVVDAEWTDLLARLALAGEQSANFLLGEIEAGEQLPPHLVQALQPGGQLGGRFQAVICCDEKVVGTNLPSVFQLLAARGVGFSSNPAAANESLARLVARNIFLGDPTEIRMPNFAGFRHANAVACQPLAIELLVAEHAARLCVAWAFAHRFGRPLEGQRQLLSIGCLLCQVEQSVCILSAVFAKLRPSSNAGVYWSEAMKRTEPVTGRSGRQPGGTLSNFSRRRSYFEYRFDVASLSAMRQLHDLNGGDYSRGGDPQSSRRHLFNRSPEL